MKMRQFALLMTIVLLFSCGGPKSALKVDRTNPIDTATGILVAYKNKNLNILKQLSTSENIEVIDRILLNPDMVEGRRIFSDWRSEMVDSWDGSIKEVRTQNNDVIYALFYEPSNALSSTKVGVVALELEGGQWSFSDIHSPTKGSYSQLKKLDF